MAIKFHGKTLTRAEQKAKVMKRAGWSSEQYSKEYDKLRNRVRAYEKATGAKASESVADLLYHDVSRRRYGARPTFEMQAIQTAPSISTGKKAVLSSKAKDRIVGASVLGTFEQFEGVIYGSKYSKDIEKELNEIRKTGREPTAGEFREIAEKYANQLEDERKEIKKINETITDPAEKIFFHST